MAIASDRPVWAPIELLFNDVVGAVGLLGIEDMTSDGTC